MQLKKIKLILTRGLMASGKSTWSKQFVLDNPEYVRVNRDDLRAMLFGMKFSNKNEELVSITRDHCITEALKQGRSVIVDETGLNPKTQAQMKRFAKDHNAEFQIKDFDKDVESCILDDMKRPNPVGSKVITHMARKYNYPPRNKQQIDNNKNWCIICDLDGTIAECGSRNPYDTAVSIKDTPIHFVIDILKKYSDHKIIFVTGRNEKYRNISIEWIEKYLLFDYSLYMRPELDKRKDFIIKKEIYELYIKPTYNVRFCIEDRPRVIRQYRKLGLNTLNPTGGAEF